MDDLVLTDDVWKGDVFGADKPNKPQERRAWGQNEKRDFGSFSGKSWRLGVFLLIIDRHMCNNEPWVPCEEPSSSFLQGC